MLNNEIVIFAELRCLLPPHETKCLSVIPIFSFTVLKPGRPCKRQCKEGNRTTWVYRECFLAISAKIFFGFLSCRLPVVAVDSIGPTAFSLLVEVRRGEQDECRSPPKKLPSLARCPALISSYYHSGIVKDQHHYAYGIKNRGDARNERKTNSVGNLLPT